MNKLKLIMFLMLAMPCMMQASDKEITTKQTTPDNTPSIEYGDNLLHTRYCNHTQPLNFGDRTNYFQDKYIINGTGQELILENKAKLLATGIATIKALNGIEKLFKDKLPHNQENDLTLTLLTRASEKILLEKATSYFALIKTIQEVELNEAKLKN